MGSNASSTLASLVAGRQARLVLLQEKLFCSVPCVKLEMSTKVSHLQNTSYFAVLFRFTYNFNTMVRTGSSAHLTRVKDTNIFDLESSHYPLTGLVASMWESLLLACRDPSSEALLLLQVQSPVARTHSSTG